ncbi:hypothetical protein FHT44_004876 [Mycolicibacterium sp. BK634]|uniref:DUF6307 family protein n=1 Tax=Mycobacteriaceae TaxID=1762 RepID=UPI00105E7922|nr:hypothetical protein [Mycolicibacterium sp. BK634]TDO17391.1 hypothetical protein EV580_0564 [Mycobacterium sp. BK086]
MAPIPRLYALVREILKTNAIQTMRAIGPQSDGLGVLSAVTGSSITSRHARQRRNFMASPTTVRSPYLHRLDLVADIIKSESKLGDKAAREVAAKVLHALNSIPEKIR